MSDVSTAMDLRSLVLISSVLYLVGDVAFLPEGLSLAVIFAPVFAVWTLRDETTRLLALALVATMGAYFVVHLSGEIDSYKYYLRSCVLLLCLFFFAMSLRKALQQDLVDYRVMKWLLITNFVLVIVAVVSLIGLPNSWLAKTLWYHQEQNVFTSGVQGFTRLRLLTYEASYYALVFAPIAIYFGLRIFTSRQRRPLVVAGLVAIPLVLSFSVSMLGALALACAGWMLLSLRRRTRPTVAILVRGIGVFAIAVLMIFVVTVVVPDNPIGTRFENIVLNRDSSGRGRTYESMVIAWRVAGERSHLFGVGPGQVKELGRPVILSYYRYPETWGAVRIPSAAGDTMAVFGAVGLIMRILLELWLFVRTRVLDNDFRLLIFLFVFIYQFGGSFLGNVPELVLWIIAFTRCFPEFDVVGAGSWRRRIAAL